jgi:hypothetical protein
MVVFLTNSIPIVDLRQQFESAARLYLKDRRAVYNGMIERGNEEEERYGGANFDLFIEPDWNDLNTALRLVDPMITIYPKIGAGEVPTNVDEDPQAAVRVRKWPDVCWWDYGRDEVSAEEEDEEYQGDAVDDNDDEDEDGDLDENGNHVDYELKVYSCSVLPSATSKGQTNLFAELGKSVENAHGRSTEFRVLYREDLEGE